MLKKIVVTTDAMILKNTWFILLVFCAFLHNAYTQSEDDCAPDGAQQILLSANATLSWYMDPFQHCEITSFQIYIENDKGQEYFFEVTENFLDVSFLQICDEWSYTIVPMSNGTIGFGRTLTAPIPLPPDADLSLSYFNATLLEGRNVLVEWDLANHTYGNCSLYYQITITSEELATLYVYVWSDRVNLTFLSPCITHQLSTKVINNAQPNIEGPSTSISFDMPPKPQIMPSLAGLEIGETSFNMTWTLEGEYNMCPLEALYVDGGSNFNYTVPLNGSVHLEGVELELSGLKSNSMYFFKVYVENSGGISPAFPLSVQTLNVTSN